MRCVVELCGANRNGRKMIAWGGASAAATRVTGSIRAMLSVLFIMIFSFLSGIYGIVPILS